MQKDLERINEQSISKSKKRRTRKCMQHEYENLLQQQLELNVITSKKDDIIKKVVEFLLNEK